MSELKVPKKSVRKKNRRPVALQVVPCINIETGGPAVSVPRLAQGVARHGYQSALFTLDYSNLGPMNLVDDVKTVSVPTSALNRFFRGESKRALSRLNQIAAQADIVHNHGIWMAPNRYARIAANLHDKPLIISPRGMLADWSMRYHRVKKMIAWHAYEKKNLDRANLFHCTSPAEANAIRHLGFDRTPIVMIPNGVDLPRQTEPVGRDHLERNHPSLRGQKWILFLSRLHSKKGIEDLLWAWSQLSQEYSDWHLILAGPDLTGYTNTVQKIVYDLEIPSSVTMTGPLSGSERLSALGNCEVFVLPSHSENFGLVVAEALSFSKPVIATRGTPWQELENSRCGWWIEKDPEKLKCVLREALTMTSQERHEMGRRGYDLVKDRYTWDSVAQEMATVYHWILNQGPPPASLVD